MFSDQDRRSKACTGVSRRSPPVGFGRYEMTPGKKGEPNFSPRQLLQKNPRTVKDHGFGPIDVAVLIVTIVVCTVFPADADWLLTGHSRPFSDILRDG